MAGDKDTKGGNPNSVLEVDPVLKEARDSHEQTIKWIKEKADKEASERRLQEIEKERADRDRKDGESRSIFSFIKKAFEGLFGAIKNLFVKEDTTNPKQESLEIELIPYTSDTTEVHDTNSNIIGRYASEASSTTSRFAHFSYEAPELVAALARNSASSCHTDSGFAHRDAKDYKAQTEKALKYCTNQASIVKNSTSREEAIAYATRTKKEAEVAKALAESAREMAVKAEYAALQAREGAQRALEAKQYDELTGRARKSTTTENSNAATKYAETATKLSNEAKGFADEAKGFADEAMDIANKALHHAENFQPPTTKTTPTAEGTGVTMTPPPNPTAAKGKVDLAVKATDNAAVGVVGNKQVGANINLAPPEKPETPESPAPN